MQLIWVSGPTDKLVTISITQRKVRLAMLLVVAGLVLLGGLFHWLGLRVAVEHLPELALKMGGVASQQEQERMEAAYEARLASLQAQLGQTVDRLQQIEASRQAFFAQIGLGALAGPAGRAQDKREGRGGPLKPLMTDASESLPLADRLQYTATLLGEVDDTLERAHQNWLQQERRLEVLPLALPLQNEFMLSSTFGIRPDPMTHLPSMHEGIDFAAPVGTPVQVTAAGQVMQARYNGAYGNMVEVEHAEGFVTRYAHLKSILVKPGQILRAGERVGLLGNTGRSTGPHLHYEVIYKGRAMHPVKAIQSWAKS